MLSNFPHVPEPHTAPVTIGAPPVRPARAVAERPGIFVGVVVLSIAILIGAGDGYLAYVIESPGASLAGSCLLVAFVAGIAAVAGWWFCRKRNRFAARLFVATLGVVGVLAVWWAWAFAMPAAMAWDSSATPGALTALQGLPPNKSFCEKVVSGSVGPLDAPYERCAIVGGPGATVTYYAGNTANSPARGLIFFEGSRIVGTDQFVRHLTGDWYAFSLDPAGVLGYSFAGGG